MADQHVNSTNLAQTLKTVYLDPLNKALNDENELLQGIEDISKDVKFEGLKIVWPIHYGRGAGVRAGTSGGVLPTPSHQKIKQVEETCGILYGRVRWENEFVERSASGDAAFTKELQFSMDALKLDLQREYGRQVAGDGSGKIAALTATADGTPTTGSPLTVAVDDARFFDPGMHVDIVAVSGSNLTTRISAGPTVGFKVVDVDHINNVIYLEPFDDSSTVTTASTAIGDWVVTHGSFTAGSTTLEIKGIQSIIGTGALHGITPTASSYNWWKSIVADGGGAFRNISTMELYRVLNMMEDRGSYPNQMFMTKALHRSLMALMETKLGYQNTVEIKPGIKVPAFEGPGGPIRIKSSRYAPKNTILLPDSKRCKVGFAQMGKGMKWFDADGQIIRVVPNYAMFEATLIMYRQMMTIMRDGHAKITYINEDASI